MSSAPHAPGPAGHPAPHDDHAFTGEPVAVLAADEPRTPGWLPLLGIALFTGAAVFVLIGHDPEVAAAASPDGVAAAQAPQVVRPDAPRPSPPPGTPPPTVRRLGEPGAPPGQPAPSASGLAGKLTPEQMDMLRKARGARPGRPPAH